MSDYSADIHGRVVKLIGMLHKTLPALLLLFLITGHARAGLLDSGFTAEFQVYKSGTYLGIATRTLKRSDENILEFSSHTVPKGFVALFVSDQVVETSRLKKTQDRFIPVVYTYDQTGGKKQKHYRLRFDWDKQLLLSTYDNKQHPLTTGTQELLGFQLQLMLDLANGKRAVSYAIADRKGIENYTLTNTGLETVQTAKGNFKSIKMESNITPKGDKYILWCAESMNFLPIRVKKIRRNGDEIELVLNSIKL